MTRAGGQDQAIRDGNRFVRLPSDEGFVHVTRPYRCPESRTSGCRIKTTISFYLSTKIILYKSGDPHTCPPFPNRERRTRICPSESPSIAAGRFDCPGRGVVMRFRIRTAMVLVALIALLITAGLRPLFCLGRANYHRSVAGRTPGSHGLYAFWGLSRETDGSREHAAWHQLMADRFMYVAYHPWLALPTDSPEPPFNPKPPQWPVRWRRMFRDGD